MSLRFKRRESNRFNSLSESKSIEVDLDDVAIKFVKLFSIYNSDRQALNNHVYERDVAESYRKKLRSIHPALSVRQYVEAARESGVRINSTILDHAIRLGVSYSDLDHFIMRGVITEDSVPYVVGVNVDKTIDIDDDRKQTEFTYLTTSVEDADYNDSDLEIGEVNILPYTKTKRNFTSKKVYCKFILHSDLLIDKMKTIFASIPGRLTLMGVPRQFNKADGFTQYRCCFEINDPDNFTPAPYVLYGSENLPIGLIVPTINIRYKHDVSLVKIRKPGPKSSIRMFPIGVSGAEGAKIIFCNSSGKSKHTSQHLRTIKFSNAVTTRLGQFPDINEFYEQIREFTVSAMNRSHSRGRYRMVFNSYSIIGEFALYDYKKRENSKVSKLGISTSLITGIDFKFSISSIANPLYPCKDMYMSFGSDNFKIGGEHWLSQMYNTTDLWTGLSTTISQKEDAAVRYQSSDNDNEISGRYSVLHFTRLIEYLTKELQVSKDVLYRLLIKIFSIDAGLKISYPLKQGKSILLSRGSILMNHRNQIIFILDDVTNLNCVIDPDASYSRQHYIRDVTFSGMDIKVIPLSVHLVHLFWHACRDQDFTPIGVNGTSVINGVQISNSDSKYRYIVPKFVPRKLPDRKYPKVFLTLGPEKLSMSQDSLVEHLRLKGDKVVVINGRKYLLSLSEDENQLELGSYTIPISSCNIKGDVISGTFDCKLPKSLFDCATKTNFEVPVYSTFRGLSAVLLEHVSAQNESGGVYRLIHALLNEAGQSMELFSNFDPVYLGTIPPLIDLNSNVLSNSGLGLDLMISKVITDILSMQTGKTWFNTGAHFVFDNTLTVIIPSRKTSGYVVTTTVWRHSNLLNYTKQVEVDLNKGGTTRLGLTSIYNSTQPHSAINYALDEKFSTPKFTN